MLIKLFRKFLQDVMEETLGEVVGSRSFDSLVKDFGYNYSGVHSSFQACTKP